MSPQALLGDINVYHAMPRCANVRHCEHAACCAQVLVGAHALLANGGVMAGAGNQLTAMAAKHHAVPFVVLVGLQKLSPLFPHDPSVSFNDYKVCSLTVPEDFNCRRAIPKHLQPV